MINYNQKRRKVYAKVYNLRLRIVKVFSTIELSKLTSIYCMLWLTQYIKQILVDPFFYAFNTSVQEFVK